jgi:hypothetical protein
LPYYRCIFLNKYVGIAFPTSLPYTNIGYSQSESAKIAGAEGRETKSADRMSYITTALFLGTADDVSSPHVSDSCGVELLELSTMEASQFLVTRI